MNTQAIIVRAKVAAPIGGVWMLWTTKSHIKQWNNASPDWYTPKVKIDLVPGGVFRYRMAAKDDSMSVDFEGEFDEVDEPKLLSYSLADGRKVSVQFKSEGNFTHIIETFEPESENEIELQRRGWQAILDNFKRYAEEQLSDDDDMPEGFGKNGRMRFDDDGD